MIAYTNKSYETFVYTVTPESAVIRDVHKFIKNKHS